MPSIGLVNNQVCQLRPILSDPPLLSTKWIRGRMPDQPLPHRKPLVPLLVLLATSLCGCSLLQPDSTENDQASDLKKLMKMPEPPELVGEAVVAHGMRPLEVDGVGAVHQLPGTGGPANPSVYRDQLLEEMKRHDIPDPNHFLETLDTALVRVRGTIPPGARRGDPIDIRVLAPQESRVRDLHGGWLLDTRLRQQQVMQNTIRQSEVMAIGTGTALTRADYTPGTDDTLRIEANILGGGRVQVTRKVGLILRPSYQHAKMAAALAATINRRFFFFDGTTRRGIAKAVESDFIEIEVHPRYRNNLPRMMEVIRSIATNALTSDSQTRLEELAKRTQDPTTAFKATLQLEAIGENAVPTLLQALETSNPELRFYVAEALAYLDRKESIKPLEEAARNEAAFRQPALLALQGIRKPPALDALRRLMNEPSLETRYGAFCALRRQANGKRLLKGQVQKSFWLYTVPSTAPPAIVISLRESPEIVLFGDVSGIEIPKFMMGDNGWILKPAPHDPTQIRISRFQPGKDDMRAIANNEVSSLIKGIVQANGTYGDTISLLHQAKEQGFLADQLAIDPLPRTLRTYYRDPQHLDGPTTDDASEADLVITGTAN